MTKTESPETIALRAKIFQRLGLSPTGMCPTTPVLGFRAREARMDEASLSIMSAEEIEACAAHGVAPHDYIVTRGVVNGRGTSTVFTAQPAADTGDDDIEMCMENLARAQAGVGDKRVNLIAAACAAERALKKARR